MKATSEKERVRVGKKEIEFQDSFCTRTASENANCWSSSGKCSPSTRSARHPTVPSARRQPGAETSPQGTSHLPPPFVHFVYFPSVIISGRKLLTHAFLSYSFRPGNSFMGRKEKVMRNRPWLSQ